MKIAKSGYLPGVVQAYFSAHGVRRPDGKLRYLNGKLVSESSREMVCRWEALPLVDLAKLDKFLLRHGLMTWELEQWAEDRYGANKNGYVPPEVLSWSDQ